MIIQREDRPRYLFIKISLNQKKKVRVMQVENGIIMLKFPAAEGRGPLESNDR